MKHIIETKHGAERCSQERKVVAISPQDDVLERVLAKDAFISPNTFTFARRTFLVDQVKTWRYSQPAVAVYCGGVGERDFVSVKL